MRTIEPIARLDLAVSLFFLQHRFSNEVARLSKAVSHTGDGHLYLLIGLAAVIADTETGASFLGLGLLAFAIELPIYWVLKNSFRRKRPEELSTQLVSFITPSDKYSLPSGHTAAGFLMATLIGHFYPEASLLSLIWAGLIGLSRILLGVHFLTDILIGSVLGTSCALFVINFLG